MNWFQRVSLVISLTLLFTNSAKSNQESLVSKYGPKNLIPVRRLREIAEYVNSVETTWEAKLPDSWVDNETTLLDLNHLTGGLDPTLVDKNEFKLEENDDADNSNNSSDESQEPTKKTKEKAIQCVDNGLPKHFDARERWPQCNSTIAHIYDQGNCGACWAAASVAAFTDRLCIQSNGKHTELRSVQQVLSCCHKGVAEDGCQGGWHIPVFDYIRRNGLSTGGDYDSKKGCQPYRLQPCAHHVNNTKLRSCNSYPTETAHKCKLHCYNKNYGTAFEEDRIKVKGIHYLNPCAVMNELYRRGPVVTAFMIFEDFYLYKKGVYQYATGKLRSWHVVRVIGWGEEKGTPYWLATNSWNESWGENGYFKIVRDSPGNGFFQEFAAACTVDL